MKSSKQKSKFKPIHGMRVDEIISRLTEDILNGPLSSGDRLNEQELSERFGISRGPVREALRKLEMSGLVCFTPNVGARVAYYLISDFINLFIAREAMEGMAARLAASLMDKRQKDNLRKLVDAHEKENANQQNISFLKAIADMDFHYYLVSCSQNPVLFHVLCEELYPVMGLCKRFHRSVPGRDNKAVVEHSRIMDAIEDGDEEMAELTMRRHIQAARKCVELFFENKKDEPQNPYFLSARPFFLTMKNEI
jgi:DNA-binding GntR family transcriptional regulator